jgi:hypothetical protein
MRSIRIAGIIAAIAGRDVVGGRGPTLRSAALLMDMTGAASGRAPVDPDPRLRRHD